MTGVAKDTRVLLEAGLYFYVILSLSLYLCSWYLVVCPTLSTGKSTLQTLSLALNYLNSSHHQVAMFCLSSNTNWLLFFQHLILLGSMSEFVAAFSPEFSSACWYSKILSLNLKSNLCLSAMLLTFALHCVVINSVSHTKWDPYDYFKCSYCHLLALLHY